MTITINRTEVVQQQVEKMGVFFEKIGLSPMSGRVFAFLLLGEPPHKDFYEIKDFLKASKSSISNALKDLTNNGVVDYITFSGDRKRYFRVNTKKWYALIKGQEEKRIELNNLLEEVLAFRADSKHFAFNAALQDIIDFQTYLAEGLAQLIEKWEEQKK